MTKKAKAHKKSKEDFKKLQAKWYKKLSKNGFEDLECYSPKTLQCPNTPYLRRCSSEYANLSSPDALQKLEYYQDASAFYHEHKFPSRLHKFVWLMHTQEISYRKMQSRIHSRGFKKTPSLFWISVHLNKMKKAFIAWRLSRPEAPETLEDFIESNTPVDF